MEKKYILKDRHGNERTFNNETIYVYGTDGELIPFTHGTGSGVVEPLSVTENGTFTPPEGVDGYSPVTVAVPDPAQTIILVEQKVEGFALDESFGAYTPGYMTPSPFVLNSGETYHVVWDDVGWDCTAVLVSNTDVITTVIGNGYALGLPDTGEPFLIVYNRGANSDGDSALLFSNEEKDFHIVGIWQETEATIVLDFSSGDMSVEADTGKAFAKANIPKPENLSPENIAEGVNIAGIIGTLVAGGNVVMNAGTFTGTNTAGEITVAHGLGVIPDLFVAFYDSSSTMSGTKAYTSACFIGLSEALQAKLSLSRSAFAARINSTSALSIDRFDSPLDNIGGTRVFSKNATKDYVYVGSSYVYAASGTYMWFAIAGLV